jgi:hypothetical protein
MGSFFMETLLIIATFFTGFATIGTVFVAWRVYLSQKADQKVNAARIIISEIRIAERNVDDISFLLQRGQNDFPNVLTESNWKKSAHLFARDFDQDELDSINNFYNTCEIIQDAAKRDNEYFWLATENISRESQRKLVDLIEQSVDSKTMKFNKAKLDRLKVAIIDNYTNFPFLYAPRKTLVTLTTYTQKIQKVSTSSVGIKLKKIAKLN